MNCICGCVVNLASCAVKRRVCSCPPSMRVGSVDYPAVLITIQLVLVNLLKEKPRKNSTITCWNWQLRLLWPLNVFHSHLPFKIFTSIKNVGENLCIIDFFFFLMVVKYIKDCMLQLRFTLIYFMSLTKHWWNWLRLQTVVNIRLRWMDGITPSFHFIWEANST